jgi:hypothetical protein
MASASVSSPVGTPVRMASPPKPAAPPKPAVPPKSIGESFEEFVRIWGARLAVVFVFIGMVAYVQSKWQIIPPIGRVALFFLTAAAMLAGGIFMERKEQYRVLGKSLIGGGWATAFFTTYAMYHVAGAKVIDSLELDLGLMLVVAAAMVWHTLKYDSQFITGCAFFLAFFSISQSNTSGFSLFAGVILAIGLTVIVLRRGWYELEVFGILATFLNHAWWLYPIITKIQAQFGHNVAFPERPMSLAVLACYWATFRTSYVLRKVRRVQDETISTVAALLNTFLLLGVGYYQTLHQREQTFWALLALGGIELALAQLPQVKVRRTAFVTLSTLGACLMVGAVPVRFGGSPRTMLWLIGAQAFLFAGIGAKEALFRRFGMVIGALVAWVAAAEQGVPMLMRVFDGTRTLDKPIAILFGTTAAVLYLNAHWMRRRWQELFDNRFDSISLSVLSYFAGVSLVLGVYAVVPQHWVAVALASAVLVLSFAGMQLGTKTLTMQAHVLTLISIIDVIAVNGDLNSRVRAISFLAVAGLLYVSSRFVRMFEEADEETRLAGATYTWAASGLIVLLSWFHFQDARTAVLWAAFAVVLALVGRFFKLRHFWLQAHVVAALAVGRVLFHNLESTGMYRFGMSARLVSIAAVGALLYLMSKLLQQHEFTTGDASERTGLRVSQTYTWAGTALLAILAAYETQDWRCAVVWAAFALSLGAIGDMLKRGELKWQALVLALFAFGGALIVNLRETSVWHGWLSIRVASVGFVVAALYTLQLWPPRVDLKPAYSWTGSLLASWLIWYQFPAIHVALLWAVFGLVLFEIGMTRRSLHLRLQAYVAFVAAFIRVFIVNLNAPQVPGELSARVVTVLPLALIFLYVYWRLQSDGDLVVPQARALRVSNLIAYFATVTVAAVVRFELNPESVVTGWAALAFALMASAWVFKRTVFMHQALLLLVPIAFRTTMYNVYATRNEVLSVTNPLLYGGAAAAVILFALPFAFKLRDHATPEGKLQKLRHRPEQPLFYVPVMLIAILLWAKLPSILFTLGLGIEAIAIFVFALIVGERSFRLVGLGLLVIAVLKVVAIDFWSFDAGARWLTLIGVGVILGLVTFLYGRYREKIKEIL